MVGDVLPPGQNTSNFSWAMNRMDGFLLIGETHYAWPNTPLPGTAKFGASFSTGYPDNSDGNGESWGGSFFYGIIDQLLYRELGSGQDSVQGLGWFARAGFTGTPERSPVGVIFNSGFTYTGAVPTRDEDTIGAALVWDQQTPGAAGLLAGNNKGLEMVFEVTYDAQLTPWFALQPDLQFIVQPGGSTALPDALVLGLSASIDF